MNNKALDLQKFMYFMLHREYLADCGQLQTENILNSGADGYPKAAMTYDEWVEEHDLLSE